MGVSDREFETGQDISGRTVSDRETTQDEDARRAAEAAQPPDAGGETAEEAAARVTGERAEAERAAAASEQAKVDWNALPEWARREIKDGRVAERRNKAVTEQLDAMGFAVDEETGQVIPPETQTPTQTRREVSREVAQSGLSPQVKERLLGQLRSAQLADDPAEATLEVVLEVATEMSNAAARSAVGTVLGSTERATLNSYKETFRSDPQTGDLFKLVERDFDTLVTQAKEEYGKVGVPFLVTDTLMGYLKHIALGQGIPKLRQALSGGGDTTRRDTAADVAEQTRLAPGETRGTGAQPAVLSVGDQDVLRKMARGSGTDAAALIKRVTASGRGGV